MQYENIILELMSRIKVLESDISILKEKILSSESVIQPTEENSLIDNSSTTPTQSPNTTAYIKTTFRMIDVCYLYGKKAYLTSGANIGEYADIVAAETGMNRNSAFMYIHGVKNLLEGKVFKRAISVKALRRYYVLIQEDFGLPGLKKAIAATRANIEYRNKCNLPSDSIISLCDEFEEQIH